MEKKAFDQSPLITPERLQSEINIFDAYHLPKWVDAASYADPDVPIDENVVVICAGDGTPDIYYIDPVSFAFLCEITRFGQNSVATNPNGKGSFYLKVTYTDAPEDNAPVSRLVADALSKEAVKVEKLNDLRAATLRKISSGKATKGARAVALRHAKSVAYARAPKGFDVAEYLANIEALFAKHDRLSSQQQEGASTLS